MAKGTLIHRTPALASRGRHCFPKRLHQQGKRIGGMRRSVVRQAPLIFMCRKQTPYNLCECSIWQAWAGACSSNEIHGICVHDGLNLRAALIVVAALWRWQTYLSQARRCVQRSRSRGWQAQASGRTAREAWPPREAGPPREARPTRKVRPPRGAGPPREERPPMPTEAGPPREAWPP